MELLPDSTRTFTCFSRPPTVRSETLPAYGFEAGIELSRVRAGEELYAVGQLVGEWQSFLTGGVLLEGADAVRRKPTAAEARTVAGVTDAQGRAWGMERINNVSTIKLYDPSGTELASGPGVGTLFTNGAKIFRVQNTGADLISFELAVDLATRTISETERARRPQAETISGVAWQRSTLYPPPSPGARSVPTWRTSVAGGERTTFIELLDAETLMPVWTSAAITCRDGGPAPFGIMGFRETPRHLAVSLDAKLPLNSGAQVVNGATASTWQVNRPGGGTGIQSRSEFLLLISSSTSAVELVVPDFNPGAGFAMDPAGGFFVAAGIRSLVRFGPDLKRDEGPPPDVTSPGFDCGTQSFALTDAQALTHCQGACVYCVEKYSNDPNTGAPRTPTDIARLQGVVDAECSILHTLGTQFESKCPFCPSTNAQCR